MLTRLQRLPETLELLTFLIVAEERSLARAGIRLRVSATAVAKRIDNLEAVLDRKLLTRGPRGVELTWEGRQMRGPAARLVEAAEALLGGDRPSAALPGVYHLIGGAPARSTEAILNGITGVLAGLFQTVSDGIMIQRASDGAVIDVNDAFCDVVGRDREQLLGRSPGHLDLWAEPRDHPHPSDRSQVPSVRRTVARATSRVITVTTFRVDIDPEPLQLSCISNPSASWMAELRTLKTR